MSMWSLANNSPKQKDSLFWHHSLLQRNAIRGLLGSNDSVSLASLSDQKIKKLERLHLRNLQPLLGSLADRFELKILD